MERVLINDNLLIANDAVSRAKDAAKEINLRLIPALFIVGILPTQAVLSGLFQGNNAVEKQYYLQAQKDIDKMVNPAIREQMLLSVNIAWETFVGIVGKVRSEVKNDWQSLTFENDQFILSDGAEQEIRENCKIYLIEPKEVICFHQHEQIVKLLNEMFHDKTPWQWHFLFSQDPASGKLIRSENSNYPSIISHAR